MAKKASKLVSRAELAELLGVHAITITKWHRAGLPVAKRGGRGRASLYDVEAVRAWRDARSKAAEEASKGPLDPQQERAAKDHWQAVLAEQKALMQAGKLLDADQVERARVAELSRARAKFLAVPTAWSDRIFRAATLEGLPGVERTLQAAIRDVLRELAGPPVHVGPPDAAQDDQDGAEEHEAA